MKFMLAVILAAFLGAIALTAITWRPTAPQSQWQHITPDSNGVSALTATNDWSNSIINIDTLTNWPSKPIERDQWCDFLSHDLDANTVASIDHLSYSQMKVHYPIPTNRINIRVSTSNSLKWTIRFTALNTNSGKWEYVGQTMEVSP